MHLNRFLILVLLIIGRMLFAGNVSSELSTMPHAKGQLIVKYKDSLSLCAHCVLRDRRSFTTATRDGSESLDLLHSKFEVLAASPVFRSEAEERQVFGESAVVSTSSLVQLHNRRFTIAQARFPGRASRAAQQLSAPAIHHIYVLQMPGHIRLQQAVEEFRNDPHVEYAQLNYILQADAAPNDPYFRSSGAWGQNYDDLWGLKADKLNLAPAWDVSRGDGVVVGVIDSGVDYNHPELAKNIWMNDSEIAGNGIDDDANGFIDDSRGWDFSTCNRFGDGGCSSPKEQDNDPSDDYFHGTHVAGTIAAIGNNKQGIIGVAPGARILIAKGLNSAGQGLTSELAAAMEYAAENGADILNNSWGCGFCPISPLAEDAVNAAYALGAIVVFSAGNTAADVKFRSPSNLHTTKPIVVAASTETDEPTYFTSFGSTVDVAAPGGANNEKNVANILSLKPQQCTKCESPLIVGKDYLRLAGTSMSAPHASGVAALMLSKNPDATNEQVRYMLRATSDDAGGPGFDLHSGAGRLNAAGAVAGKPQKMEVRLEGPDHLFGTTPRAITIRGTATGEDFSHYQLSYSLENPVQWKPLRETVRTPVRNGVLGTAPFGSLPFGWKMLKLTATSKSGVEYDDVISVGTQLPFKRVQATIGRNCFEPRASGNKIVYWCCISSRRLECDRQEVFLHEVNTGKTHKIVEMPPSTPQKPIGLNSVTLGGNMVVWDVNASVPGYGGAIFPEQGLYYCLFDSATGACPIQRATKPMLRGDHPRIVGPYILYDEWNDKQQQSRTLLFDTRNRKQKQVQQGSRSSEASDISDDYIVLGINNRILLFDRKKNTHRFIVEGRLGVDGEIEHVKLSGDQLVFTKASYIRTREHILKPRSLYLYDLSTGEQRLLLADAIPAFRSWDFSEDHVVWGFGPEIKMLNTRTGEVQDVAIAPVKTENEIFWRGSPAISGRLIAWHRQILGLNSTEINFGILPNKKKS